MQQEGGYFLVSAVVMITFLAAVGFSVSELAAQQYQHVKRETYVQDAQLVAEAGLEQSMNQLNANDSFAGYTTAQQFFSNTTQGRGTFTTSFTTNADGSSKTLVSTGKVYRKTGDTTAYVTRSLRATVVGTSSQGYSVQSGPGGLILGGSANITNSTVYVNGTINLSGAAKIGTANQPLNVYAANQACPSGATPGSTYPTVCNDGSQPITLAQSTAIYGTVCATGQTSKGPNNNIQGGNGGAGLQAGCTAPPVSTPTYDRAGQISAVTTTGAGNSNTYVCNQYPFTRSWPANLKLTGDVGVGGSCDVTVNGNVYITGNLTIDGASKIRIADSLGTTRPVIMVDGTITVGGSASILANASGTGAQFISFKSSASCNPNCTTLSGNDLKTSSGVQTVSVGGSVNLPGMIFQAYWGKVTIAGSGNVGAAIGQTVDLSGAGTVIFGTTLSSGARTWAITSYQQIY